MNMRKTRTILVAGCLLFMVFARCNKEKEPTVTLLNDRFMTGNTDIAPGGVIMFKWMAEKGKADLESFTIRVNGNDMAGFPTTGIDPNLYYDSIRQEGPLSQGDYTYSFIATDSDGNFGDKSLVITVK
jgi:hypothetical protein